MLSTTPFPKDVDTCSTTDLITCSRVSTSMSGIEDIKFSNSPSLSSDVNSIRRELAPEDGDVMVAVLESLRGTTSGVRLTTLYIQHDEWYFISPCNCVKC